MNHFSLDRAFRVTPKLPQERLCHEAQATIGSGYPKSRLTDAWQCYRHGEVLCRIRKLSMLSGEKRPLLR